jgi:hypothetical protein
MPQVCSDIELRSRVRPQDSSFATNPVKFHFNKFVRIAFEDCLFPLPSELCVPEIAPDFAYFYKIGVFKSRFEELRINFFHRFSRRCD